MNPLRVAQGNYVPDVSVTDVGPVASRPGKADGAESHVGPAERGG
jgi:hypothetical protein